MLAVTAGCASDDGVQPPGGQSSDIEFNRWAYEQMDHHYLWREDLPDPKKCDYTLSPADFFKSLLSPRDRFSYLTGNADWDDDVTVDGRDCPFAYQLYRDCAGQVAAQVLYILPGIDVDEAEASGVRRGDFFAVENGCITADAVEVDGSGRFVATGRSRSVVLPPIGETSRPTVQHSSVIEAGAHKVGYVCYLEYDNAADIVGVLSEFYHAGIDELVLDLRYNPGGYVSTCRTIGNWILPATAYGRIFQHVCYNDIVTAERLAAYGEGFADSYFEDPGVSITGALPLQLPRMFVLTSTHTASASEATIVCSRPFMQVIIIGETTVGKGVGSYNIADNRWRVSLQPITMQYYNADGETVPDTGLEPDVLIEGTYETSRGKIGSTDEPLLNAALQIIAPGVFHPVEVPGRIRAAAPGPRPLGVPSFVKAFDRSKYSRQ